jgi:hypothetical protein
LLFLEEIITSLTGFVEEPSIIVVMGNILSRLLFKEEIDLSDNKFLVVFAESVEMLIVVLAELVKGLVLEMVKATSLLVLPLRLFVVLLLSIEVSGVAVVAGNMSE